MMRPLFSRGGLKRLRELAEANTMLALDYDGTLSPIVRAPNQAQMRARTRELLTRAANLYPTVIISGRAQRDVLARMGEVPVVGVSGNHGLEPSPHQRAWRNEVRAWLPVLRRALSGSEVKVEDKNYSLALHFRSARDPSRASRQARAASRTLAGARAITGKRVLNLVPIGAPNKADALREMRRHLRCDAAIFVGDDQTDEDVFRLSGPELLAVRVRRSARSAAPWFLRDQHEIDAMLEALIDARRPSRALSL